MQKERTVMRLTALYWGPPRGRAYTGNWVAVYQSAGGSRVHHWDIKDVPKEEKDKAQQLAEEYGKELTWEKLKQKQS